MKNMVVSLALLLGTTSVFAHTPNVKVCSVGRYGQVYTTEFVVEGNKVTMVQDGEPLEYTLVSAQEANLKSASKIAGEKVVQATQYVLSSPQGTTTLQIAIGASEAQYMLFPENGIMGATSENCE